MTNDKQLKNIYKKALDNVCLKYIKLLNEVDELGGGIAIKDIKKKAIEEVISHRQDKEKILKKLIEDDKQ